LVIVPADVTVLLGRWNRGDAHALDDLIPVVYAELRAQARRALRRERSDHTLQPTALVHEAFVRLVPQSAKPWQNREHFFAVCAALMRQVLVDHARRRATAKRGSGALKVPLEDAGEQVPRALPDVDLLPLDEALSELAAIDPARAKVVEMRTFAGMTILEIADVSGRSEWDVKKDWKLAKAWLARRLRQG
jgi:RNA polymerase sigma factor (TIGR02999 family)